jgi:hypothetical protein
MNKSILNFAFQKLAAGRLKWRMKLVKCTTCTPLGSMIIIKKKSLWRTSSSDIEMRFQQTTVLYSSSPKCHAQNTTIIGQSDGDGVELVPHFIHRPIRWLFYHQTPPSSANQMALVPSNTTIVGRSDGSSTIKHHRRRPITSCRWRRAGATPARPPWPASR